MVEVIQEEEEFGSREGEDGRCDGDGDGVGCVPALDFYTKYLRGRGRLLTEALERITTSNRSELVMLQGDVGSGKTLLAQQLSDLATQNGGFFCVGKFDKARRHHPHGAIIDAFNDICHFLLQTDDLDVVRRSLNHKLGGDDIFLQHLIPNLASVLDVDDLTDSCSGMQSFARFKGVSRRFLNAVAAPNRPLVLFFDDLAYADRGSLQLIKSLITDACSKHVLIVTTCNNASRAHEKLVAETGQQWATSKEQVHNLTAKETEDLVAETMKMPPDQCRSLSLYMMSKTNGNSYHAMQLLRRLTEDGLLKCSPEGEWKWDQDQDPAIPSTVSGLIQDRLERLGAPAQRVLGVAALIGNTFSPTLLKDVVSMAISDPVEVDEINAILKSAIDESIIAIGPRGQHTFTHDLVSDAICNMIPENKKMQYHLAIGAKAGLRIASDGADTMLYTSIDHYNQAMALITSSSDRTKRAQANMRAATRAMSKSGLVAALHYLDSAMAWMDGGNWTSRYEMTLEITNKLAQAHSGFGDVDECKTTVDLLLSKARTFEDKVVAYETQIDSLAKQENNEAVISLCLKVLQELGEKLPRKVSKTQLSLETMKTKRRVKGMSDSAILLVPEMKGIKLTTTLKLMALVLFHSYHAQNHELLSFTALKAIQFSLNHGRGDETAYVFSCYGMLHSIAGNQKDAYRFAELAMKLMDITSAKRSMAPATAVACSYCLHWERNLEELVQPLTRAARIGSELGDIGWSIVCGNVLLQISLSSGRHLFETEEVGRALCREKCVYTEHIAALRSCFPVWQTTLNLMARGRDTLTLAGEAMQQDEFTVLCKKTKNGLALQNMYFMRLTLACYFQAWDLALEMIGKLEGGKHLFNGSFVMCQEKFFTTLTYIAVDRKNSSKKYQKEVAKNVKELKKMVNNGTVSVVPLVLLLEAEISSLQTNKTGLKKAYDDAIASAEARDMLNIRALSNECAGIVFLHYDDYLSDQYLSEALEYYYQWGAMGKVEQLESDHKSLHSKPKVVTSVTGSRDSRTNSTGRRSNKGNKANRLRGASGRVMLFKK